MLKKIWHYLCMPLAALAIYICVQFLCTTPLGVIEDLSSRPMPGWTMGVALCVSSVVTTVLVLRIRGFGLRGAFRGAGCKPWVGAVGVVGTLAGALACDLLNETLDLELPDSLETMFLLISQSPWGVVALVLLGPIAEETVFRGGVMRPLLDRGAAPWLAVAVSAVLFGLLHGNLAQGFFAMLMGVMLALLYLRTRSLLLGCISHVLNNAASVALMLIYGEVAGDMKLGDLLGGAVATHVVLPVCGAVCVAAFVLFWRQTSSPAHKA